MSGLGIFPLFRMNLCLERFATQFQKSKNTDLNLSAVFSCNLRLCGIEIPHRNTRRSGTTLKTFLLKRTVVHELGLVFLDLRCNSRFDFSVDYGRGSEEEGHQSTLGAIGMVPRYVCSPVNGVQTTRDPIPASRYV